MSRFYTYKGSRRPASRRFLYEASGDDSPRIFSQFEEWKYGDKHGYIWVGFAIKINTTEHDLRALNEAFNTQTINGLYFIIRGEVASGGSGKIIDWLKGNRDTADLFRQHLVKRQWEKSVADYEEAQANGTADLFTAPSAEMPNVKQMNGETNHIDPSLTNGFFGDDYRDGDDGTVDGPRGRGIRIAQSFTKGKTEYWYAVTFSDNENKARMVNDTSMIAMCRAMLEQTASEAANAETYANSELSNIDSLLAELDEYAEAVMEASEGNNEALEVANQHAMEAAQAEEEAVDNRPIWMRSEMGNDVMKTFNPHNKTQRADLNRRMGSAGGDNGPWGHHEKGDYLIPTEYIQWRCSQIRDILLSHICFMSTGAKDTENMEGTNLDVNRQTIFGDASNELPRSILNIASFKLGGRGNMSLSIRDYWDYVAEHTENFNSEMDNIQVNDPERYDRITSAINDDAVAYANQMQNWMTNKDLSPEDDFEPVKNPNNRNYLNCNRRWLGRILREAIKREMRLR